MFIVNAVLKSQCVHICVGFWLSGLTKEIIAENHHGYYEDSPERPGKKNFDFYSDVNFLHKITWNYLNVPLSFLLLVSSSI